MTQFMNEIIIASAGSGKTTKIVNDSLATPFQKILIITYTNNNFYEIETKFYKLNGFIPANVTILTWFGFLLCHFVKPYQNSVYDNHRIAGINFVPGKSTPFIKKSNIKEYFLDDNDKIYTDKISEFGLKCNKKSKGLVLVRLEKLYKHLYIDEVQDLAGYDIEILKILLHSQIDITLVGDHRQATYSTNQSSKNKKYSGANIIDKFKEWERKNKCTIINLNKSHRCNQEICDFADIVYPHPFKTISKNTKTTEHDGIFVIGSNDVQRYVEKFSPQALLYNKTTNCLGLNALNFGASKGLSFDRILIFPHGPLKKMLSKGDISAISKSAAKVYVAITRARNSVTFVLDDTCQLNGIETYQFPNLNESSPV